MIAPPVIDVGTTPRKALTPKQRLALFEREGGICCVCHTRIVGAFVDEHKRALGLGGSNAASNRGVTHPKCASVKTHDFDMPRIVKAKAQKRAAHAIKPDGKKIQSAGFAPAPEKTRSDRSGKIDKSALPKLAMRICGVLVE